MTPTRPDVLLRFDPALHPLLPAARRPAAGGSVGVPADGSSLGHLVESVGVPLTEVGELSVGAAVPVAWRPAGGEVVSVGARPRPQPTPTDPPRFLLDVHLGTLARRLRLLGIDAAWAPAADADDAELAARSARESRVLLTRDRGLLKRRAVLDGAHVHGDRPEDQLADVLDRFRPPTAPFTRCLRCNGLLHAVDKQDVEHLLPEGTRQRYERFASCGDCGRVYWEGAHAAALAGLVERAGED